MGSVPSAVSVFDRNCHRSPINYRRNYVHPCHCPRLYLLPWLAHVSIDTMLSHMVPITVPVDNEPYQPIIHGASKPRISIDSLSKPLKNVGVSISVLLQDKGYQITSFDRFSLVSELAHFLINMPRYVLFISKQERPLGQRKTPPPTNTPISHPNCMQ